MGTGRKGWWGVERSVVVVFWGGGWGDTGRGRRGVKCVHVHISYHPYVCLQGRVWDRQSYVLQIVYFCNVSCGTLWISHMYHRGIQCARNALLLLLTWYMYMVCAEPEQANLPQLCGWYELWAEPLAVQMHRTEEPGQPLWAVYEHTGCLHERQQCSREEGRICTRFLFLWDLDLQDFVHIFFQF